MKEIITLLLSSVINFNANAALGSAFNDAELGRTEIKTGLADSAAPLKLLTKTPVFPDIEDADLGADKVNAWAMIYLNPDGKIDHIELRKGTGNPTVDNYIISSLSTAEFKPYVKNGIPRPVILHWPVELRSSSYGKPLLNKILDSF